MLRSSVLLFALVSLSFASSNPSLPENLSVLDMTEKSRTIWDFTKTWNDSEWTEQSDVVREPGMSKAVLTLHKSRLFQRAVFFTMLNPQPNGAGFAGVRSVFSPLDLSNFSGLQIRARAQGENFQYKICLHHKGLNNEPNPTYEQMFPMPNNEFTVVSLPFAKFDPYYRGRKQNVSEVGELDTAQITSFGFQMFGGVYLPIKQSGVSTLEIDWVKAI